MRSPSTCYWFMALTLATFILFACKNDNEPQASPKSIIPTQFSINIPSSLSNNIAKKGGENTEYLTGNQVYHNLNSFIYFGAQASKFIEDAILLISKNNINRPMIFTYKSKEDQRMKNLEVKTNRVFEGKTWQYGMKISDADLEGNADKGIGIELFWNISPVEGIGIAKLKNVDQTKYINFGETMYRVDYSSKANANYDAQMTIQISNFPMPQADIDPYAINNLKFFVGKKGDIIDVYGNSNHPNARIFGKATGFNWVFCASSSNSKNIAVAEIGLPPNTATDSDRSLLLEYYSIRNVYYREIKYMFPNIGANMLNSYLSNTEAPGFFDNRSFVSAGTPPEDADYSVVQVRLKSLSPFKPKDVNELNLSF